MSSISTDWSTQLISIKSDLPIFNDLSIDKSIPIFIDWLLRDYLQDRALHLIITTHHPLSSKSESATALSTFINCSKYLHFSLHKYKEVITLYNSKMMEIDPIDKFIKLSKSLFIHLLLPLCSTAQHRLVALSLQSVTSTASSLTFIMSLYIVIIFDI